MEKKHYSFLYRNGLSLALLSLIFIFWSAQAYTGWKEYNKEREEKMTAPVSFKHYFTTGHFIEATFENWESEFLQMGLYVLLTIHLRQLGSSESKKLEGKEEVDREPQPHENAPWPVKKGGFVLLLYKNSLFIAFSILFIISFMLHAWGSLQVYNEEQMLDGKPTETMSSYFLNSKFWFESFQNWQSEFVALISLVVFTIYLRQKGSPQSKPVDAPYDETGK